MKRWISIFVLFLFCMAAQSQSLPDSLNLILKNCKSDSERVSFLNKMGEECGMEEIHMYSYPALRLINKALKNISVQDKNYLFYLNSKAEAINNIGCFFMEKDQNDSALKKFSEALEIMKKSSGKAELATCLNNIGHLYCEMGENEMSLKYNFSALSIRLKIKDTNGIAMSYNNLATVSFNQGKINKALNFYKDALKLYEQTGDDMGIATALNNIGLIYNNLGDVEKSLDYFHRSLRIIERMGDRNRGAITLSNIGYIYQLQGELDKAEEYYRNSIKIHREIKSQSGLAQALNNLGELMDTRGRNDEALKYYMETLLIRKEINDRAGLAASYNSLGNFQKNKGNLDSALNFFFKSYSLFEEVGDPDGMSMSASYSGEIYLERNNLKMAEEQGNLSLKYARSIGFPEKIYYACDLLRLVFKKKGDYKNELAMFKTCVKMKDSILNDENRKAGIKKQFQYQYEKEAIKDSIFNRAKMNEENLRHESAISKQRTYTTGGFIGLGLMLIAAVVSIRAFRNKQRANIVITRQKHLSEMQKHIIEEKQKEIIDSINYARRIQTAHLPSEKYINRKLTELSRL